MKIKAILFGLIVLCLFTPCTNVSKGESSNSKACFDTIFPVVYNCMAANNGDYAFRIIPSKKLRVQLIPNLATRTKMQMKSIKNVIGMHQFFLDHDLVSGFVHNYTLNMFNSLKPTDFVLRFKADFPKSHTGTISYTTKDKLTSSDTLGKNIAYFRQWRLSEIDYEEKNGKIFINTKNCTFNIRCACPQSKKKGNLTQIPLWQSSETGYQSIEKFSAFGYENGGTVVIVWHHKNEIWFQDIHSSWKEILLRAIEISKTYHTDPAICISDAGPFARKIKADKNFTIQVKDIDNLAPRGKLFGAGFAYDHQQK
jgi:hypothetical protein